MHCTILLSAHSCAFAMDHTELELKELMEQAQAEDITNLAWIKAIPGAFNQCSLSFIFESLLFVLIGCALS
jgi:hypothetical protein